MILLLKSHKNLQSLFSQHLIALYCFLTIHIGMSVRLRSLPKDTERLSQRCYSGYSILCSCAIT